MIGHSLPELVFIRICIFGLRLIAPLSIAYVVASWWRGAWIVSRWLGYYAVVEAVFYLFVYVPRSRHLQKVSRRVLVNYQPFAAPKGERSRDDNHAPRELLWLHMGFEGRAWVVLVISDVDVPI